MKKSLGERVFDIFNVFLMIFLCVIFIYPYLNQLAISLNDGADTMMGGLTIFPRKFTWVNYRAIVTNDDILRAVVLTASVTIVQTVLVLVTCLGAAYGTNKKDLPFRNFIIWFLLLPGYLSAGIIPTYILYRYLHMLNNVLCFILPGAFTFYNMVIIRTYLQGLPKGLEEAAYVEGANEMQILFKIILPLCMPVLATVALWTLVGGWNGWTTTLYYVNDKKLYQLQYVIMQLIKQSEMIQKMAAEAAITGTDISNVKPTSDSIKSAAIIFSTLPIVMSYPFLQKYFVKGVTVGAIKE